MFLLSSVVFGVFLQSAIGDPYCSLNDTNIDCVPCSENCVSSNQTCFLCPKHCGKSNDCKTVCEPTCFNQTCEEVVDDTVPVCTRGCLDGRAGKQCQDHCPEGCKTCDQDTGTECTTCLEDREGQYCNITILSSQSTIHYPATSMRECAKHCEICKVWKNCEDHCDCTGLTTDSTQYPLTTTEKPGSENKVNSVVDADAVITAAAAGAGAGAGAVFVIVVVICIATICLYRKFQSRPCGMDRTTNYNTDESSFTHTGYTYIDEPNLGSCHDRTNVRPINGPPCSGDNHFEEMGNRISLAEEDNESESSVSNESDAHSHFTISEGQLNENVNIELVEVYEMNCLNYITPDANIYVNQGVCDV